MGEGTRKEPPVHPEINVALDIKTHYSQPLSVSLVKSSSYPELSKPEGGNLSMNLKYLSILELQV